MRREKIPPVNARMFDQLGNLDRQWLYWFQRVGVALDNYKRSPDKVFTNIGGTLTTDDYGKNIRFNNGSNNVMCYLMTPADGDMDCWVTIFRTGTGALTVIPDAASRIEYGSLGGRIWCDEQKRAAANLTLQLISTTQWAIIGATGLWKFA